MSTNARAFFGKVDEKGIVKAESSKFKSGVINLASD